MGEPADTTNRPGGDMLTDTQRADSMTDEMLLHNGVPDNGETSSSAAMAAKPHTGANSLPEMISKLKNEVRLASLEANAAEEDHETTQMYHERVDWVFIRKRFLDNGIRVPEGVQMEADAWKAALRQAESRLKDANKALETLRKNLSKAELAFEMGMPLPKETELAIVNNITPQSGTKQRLDVSEKTLRATGPPKRSKNKPESFVDSFDKLIPSHWQSMITQAGEQHKQQTPNDPSTLLTLRAVYEVIDELVDEGKLQRGKDIDMDENGWPAVYEYGFAPSRSRASGRPAFEDLTPHQKLGLLTLSKFDARVPRLQQLNPPAPEQQTNDQSAKKPAAP
ncbi:hypothetical protein PG984_008946 [Apiospora sp. TS-2023a]